MVVPSSLPVVELPRAIRDALVRLLLDELAVPESAGSVASAERVLACGGASGTGPHLDGPAAAGADLLVLHDAVARAGTEQRERARPRADRGEREAELAALRALVCARARSYRIALDAAPRGDSMAVRLAQARVLFAQHLFFEVHEVLEPSWRAAAGDDRRFLQGLIQAAVAWHHGVSGRRAAALRQATAASAKLADAGAWWQGFPVALLTAQLDAYRLALTEGREPAPCRLAL